MTVFSGKVCAVRDVWLINANANKLVVGLFWMFYAVTRLLARQAVRVKLKIR